MPFTPALKWTRYRISIFDFGAVPVTKQSSHKGDIGTPTIAKLSTVMFCMSHWTNPWSQPLDVLYAQVRTPLIHCFRKSESGKASLLQ